MTETYSEQPADKKTPITTAPADAWKIDGGAVEPAAVLRKVAWRLVPFLCFLYVLNIVDRANVGFARLSMEDDLNIPQGIFDLGIGMFYVGYLLFEVPSNLLLRRVGARRWIARIMISWGIISCAMMMVKGAVSFYFLRILLGFAEAGFFPGIILYLTYWFPTRERARVTALFMMAIAISGVISNPLSGAIMQYMPRLGELALPASMQPWLDPLLGLKGWQWLFLLEGLPSVLVGFLVYYCLPDSPEQARWLKPAERSWLLRHMADEEQYRQARHGADLRRALLDGRVWFLICVYFTVAVGANASGAYFPKLLGNSFQGRSKFEIGLLSALPHLCSVVAMIIIGTHSDRTGERRGHVAFTAFLAALGWGLSYVAGSPWLALTGFCLAQAGMMSMLPIFWTLPTAFLSGAAAAGGIALINSVANIGGIVGPWILGRFGLPAMAIIMFLGGALVLAFRHDNALDRGFGSAEGRAGGSTEY